MTSTLGVGIIGAGLVTQAIHIPTLARLADLFSVVHVMDVDADLAARVARSVGARHSTDIEHVMADEDVDVVAICSPPRVHATQVEAAVAAKKKGILCEKPFAVSQDEAARLTELLRASNVPIIVGAMHAFDPGWTAVFDHPALLPDPVTAVRSTIVLPPNSRFENWATQIEGRPSVRASVDDLDRVGRAAMLRSAVLGLAVHDLPLVRRFVPHVDSIEVVHAEFVPPSGYQIVLRAGGVILDLLAYMHRQWRPDWTLEFWSSDRALTVQFTPSYVQAGSAVSVLRGPHQSETFGPFPQNGYDAEWRNLAELAAGRGQSPAELDAVIDDLNYAIALADRVQAFAEGGIRV